MADDKEKLLWLMGQVISFEEKSKRKDEKIEELQAVVNSIPKKATSADGDEDCDSFLVTVHPNDLSKLEKHLSDMKSEMIACEQATMKRAKAMEDSIGLLQGQVKSITNPAVTPTATTVQGLDSADGIDRLDKLEGMNDRLTRQVETLSGLVTQLDSCLKENITRADDYFNEIRETVKSITNPAVTPTATTVQGLDSADGIDRLDKLEGMSDRFDDLVDRQTTLENNFKTTLDEIETSLKDTCRHSEDEVLKVEGHNQRSIFNCALIFFILVSVCCHMLSVRMEDAVQDLATEMNSMKDTIVMLQRTTKAIETGSSGTQTAFDVAVKISPDLQVWQTPQEINQYDIISVSNPNMNEGIFTAPVDGVYAFFIEVLMYGELQVGLQLNQTEIDLQFEFIAAREIYMWNNNTVMKMYKGANVSLVVKRPWIHGRAFVRYCGFRGWLIK